MIRPSNIKPLTEFLRNSKTHIGALKSSGEAELLTVNGEASIVVQDAESYQTLLELAEQARQDERLRQALRVANNGDSAESANEVRLPCYIRRIRLFIALSFVALCHESLMAQGSIKIVSAPLVYQGKALSNYAHVEVALENRVKVGRPFEIRSDGTFEGVVTVEGVPAGQRVQLSLVVVSGGRVLSVMPLDEEGIILAVCRTWFRKST